MKKTFTLEDLDCANCAAKMEAAIKKLDGINDANVSFMTQKLSLDINDSADYKNLMKTVQKTIKKIEPDCSIIM